ncbi:hypothetical protein AX16_008831 [Volvariella volvacea WC 439]|nr:hypothetical protein AX16_008831 [Volvariella volvacea WC 439]
MASHTNRKRAATSNGEPSSSRGTKHANKKTRFVEPEDDPANFEEQVDASLEDPNAHRRGQVKNEGYESDSTDDGEGIVYSRKKDDDEDDMFAIGNKEDKNEDNGGKKKAEKYLRLGDIEGQEFANEQSNSDNSDSEVSDEPEDEDDAERKKKAGMGFELSSFNMREEMEEGKFTEDGTYVRTFDPHKVHDRWMDGLSDKEIKLARRRKRKQEKLQEQRIAAEEREIRESGGKAALEKQLLSKLKKGETVLEALQRLGAKAKKPRPGQKARVVSSTPATANKPQNTPSEIEEITSLASKLMSLGDNDIYSRTYEELVRDVRSSGDVGQSWEPPSADVKYEYKWASEASDQTFGPFSEEEMKAWYKAAYFGATGELVQVRTVGGDWDSWDAVVQ